MHGCFGGQHFALLRTWKKKLELLLPLSGYLIMLQSLRLGSELLELSGIGASVQGRWPKQLFSVARRSNPSYK